MYEQETEERECAWCGGDTDTKLTVLDPERGRVNVALCRDYNLVAGVHCLLHHLVITSKWLWLDEEKSKELEQKRPQQSQHPDDNGQEAANYGRAHTSSSVIPQ